MSPKRKKDTKKGSRKSQLPPAKPPKGKRPQLLRSVRSWTNLYIVGHGLPVELPQEIVDQIIDELSSTLDLKSSSLIGPEWTQRSQQKLLQHVVVTPANVELWLSRPETTAEKMSRFVTKFALRGDPNSSMPWDDPSTLTQLIKSLASSSIQSLTIISFSMRRFRKASLFRCFELIAESLCSLELRFLRICSPALTFLISMFPNLDDIFLERISTTSMTWSNRSYEFEYIPSFAGTFEYLDIDDDIRPALLSWILEYPLWFHTISPGMLKRNDVPMFAKLMENCAATLKEIPHVMFDAGE